MVFTMFAHLFSMLLDLLGLLAKSEHENDREILLSEQQIRILQRTRARPPRLSWGKRCLWPSWRLNWSKEKQAPALDFITACSFLHRRWCCGGIENWCGRSWTFHQQKATGRPRMAAELEALIVRLATEDPRWGYGKLEGELLKLGYAIGRSTIRDSLQRHHIPAPPSRARQGSTWRTFLRQHQYQRRACDFFTVETLSLQTLDVLFLIEIGTRRVHLAHLYHKANSPMGNPASTSTAVEAAGPGPRSRLSSRIIRL